MHMPSEEELQIYREVGKLAAKVREKVRTMVKPGETLLNIAETAERLIQEKGAKPAFPCNVSVNAIAAHYSPPVGDETRIEDGDLVSVDIGAHLDGYIADTAFTVATGDKNAELVQAVELALENAIAAIKPGVGVGEIGAIIEETAEAAGFKPISNLTGHSLARWKLHAGITIPNVREWICKKCGKVYRRLPTGAKCDKCDEIVTEPEQKIKKGDVLAIEPFVTSGAGEVEDQAEIFIFRFLGPQPVQRRMTMELLRDIGRLYGTLPFAERWLAERTSRIRLQIGMRDLMNSGAVHPYHVLKDREDGPVAQAEHTVIVTDKGCEITTAGPRKRKPATSAAESSRDPASKDQ